jgi:hypothetical protein
MFGAVGGDLNALAPLPGITMTLQAGVEDGTNTHGELVL